MNDRNVNQFGTLIANATMQAAVEILRSRGIALESIAVDALVASLRTEAKVALSTILDDGKALVDGGVGGWAATLVKAECTAAAMRAVEAVTS